MSKQAKELRAKSVSELQSDLVSAKRRQFKLRLAKHSQAEIKTHEIAALRLEIARIHTILTEKGGTHD